jgi:hypothetical protein
VPSPSTATSPVSRCAAGRPGSPSRDGTIPAPARARG